MLKCCPLIRFSLLVCKNGSQCFLYCFLKLIILINHYPSAASLNVCDPQPIKTSPWLCRAYIRSALNKEHSQSSLNLILDVDLLLLERLQSPLSSMDWPAQPELPSSKCNNGLADTEQNDTSSHPNTNGAPGQLWLSGGWGVSGGGGGGG